jgi:hypothetical protein
MSKAVFRNEAPGLSIANRGIVNDGIKITQPIYLLGHAASLRDARQIANHHGLCARNSGQRFLAPLFIASVQNYLMSSLNDKLGRHPSQPSG